LSLFSSILPPFVSYIGSVRAVIYAPGASAKNHN